MNRLTFPNPFPHSHPAVQDANVIPDEQTTAGQCASDRVAGVVGSWQFIIAHSIVLVIWVLLNVTAWINHWDP
jgi:uncharacterized membrane protein